MISIKRGSINNSLFASFVTFGLIWYSSNPQPQPQPKSQHNGFKEVHQYEHDQLGLYSSLCAQEESSIAQAIKVDQVTSWDKTRFCQLGNDFSNVQTLGRKLCQDGECESNSKAAAECEVPTDEDSSILMAPHIPRLSQYVRWPH